MTAKSRLRKIAHKRKSQGHDEPRSGRTDDQARQGSREGSGGGTGSTDQRARSKAAHPAGRDYIQDPGIPGITVLQGAWFPVPSDIASESSRNLGEHGPWTPESQAEEDRALAAFHGRKGHRKQETLHPEASSD